MTLIAQAPTDLLAYIEHTLRLSPRESLVIVTMDGPNLGALLRVDAQPASMPAEELAHHMLTCLADVEADGFLLVAYDVNRHYALGVAAQFDVTGHEMREVIVVNGGEWVAPFTGESGDYVPGESLVGLELNFGMHPGGDFPEVPEPVCDAVTVAAVESARAELLTEHADPRLDSVHRVRALWAQALERGDAAGDRYVFIAAMVHPRCRDWLIGDVYDGGDAADREAVYFGGLSRSVNWKKVQTAQRILADLVRTAPAEHAVHIMALLAHTAWMQGRGTIAGTLLDRARRIHAGNPLVRVLAQAIDCGVLPEIAKDRTRAWRPSR
jgi:hypothetical protein